MASPNPSDPPTDAPPPVAAKPPRIIKFFGFKGGLLAFIGFMLSPLSWWNDAFINLPLAHAFGWLVSRFYLPAFEVAVVVGYWLTNLLGFILMHQGLRVMTDPQERALCKAELKKDILISLGYTLVLVLLIKLKFIQPF